MTRICCTCLREGHLAHACPHGGAIRAVAKAQQLEQPQPVVPTCPGCQQPLTNLEGLLLCVQPGCGG